MINVTQTFVPAIEEYTAQVNRAFKRGWLTNRGILVNELEEKIKEKYKIPSLVLMNNGTIPLQIALKLLAKNGEVITTPFSYVATLSSIVWENCKPIFVDIDPEYLTIDENKIEEAITKKTTAILATHVFGNPCNIEAIENIAKKHNLAVIYDAAHCFAVEYQNKSIFEYGDISTCSFHSTKIFHCGEGGAAFTKDKNLHEKIFNSHNFGHKGQEEFYGLGINAKMSELNAAMGLSVLPYMDKIIEERKNIIKYYKSILNWDKISSIKIRENTKWNYSYFPIIFKNEEELLKTISKLNKEDIFPRRYFYPALNTLNYVGYKKMPIAEDISKRIICLALYYGLENKDIERIVKIIVS